MGNWENNLIPVNGDIVNMPARATNLNSVVDVGINLNSLLKIAIASGNTLILQKDITLTGGGDNTSRMSGGAIDGPKDLIIANNAEFVWGGGTLKGDPNSTDDEIIIQLGGKLTMNTDGLGTIDARNIINNGRIDWTASSIEVINAGEVNNRAGSVMDINITRAANVTLSSGANDTGMPLVFSDAQLIKQTNNVVTFDIRTVATEPDFQIQAGQLSLNRRFNFSQGSISITNQNALLLLGSYNVNNTVNGVTITGTGKTARVGTAEFLNVTVPNLQVGSNILEKTASCTLRVRSPFLRTRNCL